MNVKRPVLEILYFMRELEIHWSVSLDGHLYTVIAVWPNFH